jgi:hypothetical protein
MDNYKETEPPTPARVPLNAGDGAKARDAPPAALLGLVYGWTGWDLGKLADDSKIYSEISLIYHLGDSHTNRIHDRASCITS